METRRQDRDILSHQFRGERKRGMMGERKIGIDRERRGEREREIQGRKRGRKRETDSGEIERGEKEKNYKHKKIHGILSCRASIRLPKVRSKTKTV